MRGPAPIQPPHRMRIFAISDLHTDFRENRLLLQRLAGRDYSRDVLVVAGDVADRLDTLRETLTFLRGLFREVWFVPGNHELWVRNDPRDSVEKFAAVLETCARAGVRTSPGRAAGHWIVPLFSWYEESFDSGDEGVREELEAWSDFYFCRWPEHAANPAEHFAALNARRLRRFEGPVLTFSHFVPRAELVPPVRHLTFKGLPKVAGSALIERQLREAGSTVHVYGHTHLMGDRVIDGVRYVQNWLHPLRTEGPDAPLKLIHDAESDASLAQPMFC
jgi:predicted phosphodiesterase